MKRTVLGSQEFPGLGGVLLEKGNRWMGRLGEVANAWSRETVSVLFSMIHHYNLAQHLFSLLRDWGQGLSTGHHSGPWETEEQRGNG